MFIFKMLITVTIIFFTSQIHGFEGYEKYPMQGNTIFPLTDVDVKLSAMHVLMEREEKGIMGGSTKVVAIYKLMNLSNKKINFKVAFPIQSSCIGDCTEIPKDFKVLVNGKAVQTALSKIVEKEFLLRIKKKLLSENKKIDNPNGRQNFKNYIEKNSYDIPLIVWNIAFKPIEEKIITCTYTLDWEFAPPTDWFIYHLKPGILWKKNIEKAYFRLILPQKLIDYIKSGSAKINIESKPNYEINKNIIEWKFKNLNLAKEKKGHSLNVLVTYSKT